MSFKSDINAAVVYWEFCIHFSPIMKLKGTVLRERPCHQWPHRCLELSCDDCTSTCKCHSQEQRNRNFKEKLWDMWY